MTLHSTGTPRAAAFVRSLALVALAAGWSFLLQGARSGIASPGAATGRADVRLIRLLSEVPESFRPKEPLHDLRVKLVPGNVLVFRKGGEFSALLPIEQIAGSPDSLRYFFFVEKPSVFWVFGGGRTKGIRTAAEGEILGFNSFRLLWGRGAEGPGWIYFPDLAENKHLRFSVVGGQTVDRADPKDTKYWVELGPEEKSGF
jgi:hypothetical protein